MVVGGQCLTPTALLLGKRPSTHCIGCWVGPRAASDGYGKSRPDWDLIPDCPALGEFLYQLRYPGPQSIHVHSYLWQQTLGGVVTYFPD